MKFQLDSAEGVNQISRAFSGQVWINGVAHSGSLLVPSSGPVQPWPVDRFEALAPGHFEAVLALRPELVVFGSGSRLRFVAPPLLRGLIERRVGVETMDVAAACRTFNVLAGEGRSVVAALLLEAGGSS